jgi:hypothetical protein
MSDPDGSQARASRLPHDAPHRDATQHTTLQRGTRRCSEAHAVATQRTTLQRSTPCYNAAHDVAAQPTSWMSDPTIASSVMAHSVYATTLGYLRPPRNPKGTDAATCVERSPGADELYGSCARRGCNTARCMQHYTARRVPQRGRRKARRGAPQAAHLGEVQPGDHAQPNLHAARSHTRRVRRAMSTRGVN